MEDHEQPLEPADLDAEPRNAVYCFLDQQRPCSAECAAYKTFPEDNKHLEHHQRYCTLMQSVERGSRSLNIIAGLINSVVSKQKKADADAQRARAFSSSPASPTSTGPKT